MQLELKQSLKLSQQLVITQQIQQAIKLLQLNHLELVTEVQQEMVENPTLEEVPGTSPDSAITTELRDALPEDRSSTQESGADGGDKIDWESFLSGYTSSQRTGPQAGNYEDLPPIEANLVQAPSLADHLLWQLQMQCATDEEHAAARTIIHNLDHRGYLTVDLDAICEQCGADLDAVEGAHEIVMALDPLGCGARSLAECLRVQAKVTAPEDPFLPEIIDRHLGNIEKRNYAAIARDLGIEVEDAVEYHRMIQKLEPVPGRNFVSTEGQYITPDIYVLKLGNEWHIVLNEDGLPKLRVSPYYERLLRGGAATKEDRDYIKGRLQSAAFLIQSIHRRQRTIYKVMKSILEKQQDFFDHGVSALRPMVLRDVAEDIGVHESTVSRATTNKWVQCPQGVLELKYFFNAAISKVGGGDVASEAVKSRIRQIISREDPKDPLSDQALVDLLRAEGLKVARRTVAKYRDEQGILPSSRRKSVF
ncbi:MAG: RNA polymerase factor sigma-54 [Pseudomonadota bacterium]